MGDPPTALEVKVLGYVCNEHSLNIRRKIETTVHYVVKSKGLSVKLNDFALNLYTESALALPMRCSIIIYKLKIRISQIFLRPEVQRDNRDGEMDILLWQ